MLRRAEKHLRAKLGQIAKSFAINKFVPLRLCPCLILMRFPKSRPTLRLAYDQFQSVLVLVGVTHSTS